MSKDISFQVGGRTHTGYLADGSGGKKVPGILVIHEATGLGPTAKQRADMLAKAGYVAFAPDLFGEAVTSTERAFAIVGELTQNWADLRARCTAALEALKKQPNVDAKRTAAIGFCFGGQAVLELGRTGVDLRAIVGFHSGLTTLKPEDSGNIKAKVLVCLGDQDPLVNREARDKFMDNMTASKVDCQLLLLSGVGHSFTNPDADSFGMAGIKYDKAADQRSWSAMERLFAEAFAG
jgi:dienelactone hydrolase